jgi:hypothetical protein
MRLTIISLTMLGVSFPLAAQVAGTIHVCVSSDRVMRVEAAQTCPNGQTSYRLALAGTGGGPGATDDKSANAQVPDLKKTIDFLRESVANLQKEFATLEQVKAGGKVMAPFEVVDHSGKMIFRVRADPRGFEMATAAGQSVAWASALDQGGVFKTRSSVSFPEVVMGSAGNFGGLAIRDGENQVRAELILSGGKPSLNMNNDNHVGIVSIYQAASGGGWLQLGSPGGQAVVDAGVIAGGKCGKVATYPETNPGRTMVGAPASLIKGGC